MISKQQFTIVELIVVIAILAILASLLSPSLKSTIQSAKQTQCANQLKNIYMSMELFESDHQAHPGAWFQREGSWGNWVKNIWTYTGQDIADYGWNTNSHRRNTTQNLFHCPVTYNEVIPSKGWTAYNESERESSYAYNISLVWKHRPNIYWQDKWREPIQKGWIQQTQQTVMLIESQHHVVNSLTQYAPHVIEPHFMRKNTLFWDGHIESKFHDEITTDFQNIFWSGE